MKSQKRSIFGEIYVVIGACLIVSAASLLFFWQRNIQSSAEKMQTYVYTIRALIPEPQGAILEVRGDNAMSVLSLEDNDFIGLLELPRYGALFPVGAAWGRSNEYPCCFEGTIYEGTMQIGATSQRGQFDFYREISVGDELLFTDMMGNQYTYEIKEICYEKHADEEALGRKDAALTLFIKNIYGFEYIVVFCDVS